MTSQPYWPNSIFRVYIKPAAKKIGLTKRIGWHRFRHTFGTILNANGENPKVIQELLRHANLKATMDTYVQAVSDEKRKAQSKVVEMIMPAFAKGKRSSLMDPYWTLGENGTLCK
jgi:integrase